MIRLKEVKLMIKKIAWETFKNTGDINAFMEFKQIEDMERQMEGYFGNSSKQGLEKDSFEKKNL